MTSSLEGAPPQIDWYVLTDIPELRLDAKKSGQILVVDIVVYRSHQECFGWKARDGVSGLEDGPWENAGVSQIHDSYTTAQFSEEPTIVRNGQIMLLRLL